MVNQVLDIIRLQFRVGMRAPAMGIAWRMAAHVELKAFGVWVCFAR